MASLRDAMRRGTTLSIGKARVVEAKAPVPVAATKKGRRHSGTMRGEARRVDPKIAQGLDIYLLRVGQPAKHCGFGMSVKETMKLMHEIADDEMDRQEASGRLSTFSLQVIDMIGTVVVYDFVPEAR